MAKLIKKKNVNVWQPWGLAKFHVEKQGFFTQIFKPILENYDMMEYDEEDWHRKF